MPSRNIIQRRASANGASSSAALPTTNSDIQASGRRRHRRRKFGLSLSPYDRHSLVRWAILIAVSTAAASLLWKPVLSFFGKIKPRPRYNRRGQDISSSSHQIQQQRDPRTTSGHSALPLSQFSDLSFALQNSDLLALYFAASWCPMSTPISLALDSAFGKHEMLLNRQGGKNTLSLVYVSSDQTLEQYNGYLHNRNWMAIPFDSSQRSELKRHFSTCAHRELEELGIDRKHEIPTIIVIDTQTQGIITTNGADDIERMGEGALEHWKEMQTWIRKTAMGMT